jgi:hypothetical protein
MEERSARTPTVGLFRGIFVVEALSRIGLRLDEKTAFGVSACEIELALGKIEPVAGRPSIAVQQEEPLWFQMFHRQHLRPDLLRS